MLTITCEQCKNYPCRKKKDGKTIQYIGMGKGKIECEQFIYKQI